MMSATKQYSSTTTPASELLPFRQALGRRVLAMYMGEHEISGEVVAERREAGTRDELTIKLTESVEIMGVSRKEGHVLTVFPHEIVEVL